MSVALAELEEKAEGLVSYLESRLRKQGRFRTLRRFLGDVGSYARPTEYDGWYEFGDCPFAAASIAIHLPFLGDERLAELGRQVCEYLVPALENGIARYAMRRDGPIPFPADVEDTCLVGAALRANGFPVALNVNMIAANVDSRGRFYTWLVPRLRHLRHPRNFLWLCRDQRRCRALMKSYGTSRGRLSQMANEYRISREPAVAANVLLCPEVRGRCPAAVTALVEQVLDGDMPQQYYGSRLAAWFHLARLSAARVEPIGAIKAIAAKELALAQREDGSWGTPFQTAMGLLASMYLGIGSAESRERGVRNLLRLEWHEKGWVPFPYYNDLYDVFEDGSAELTAVLVLEALLRWRSSRGERGDPVATFTAL